MAVHLTYFYHILLTDPTEAHNTEGSDDDQFEAKTIPAFILLDQLHCNVNKKIPEYLHGII